MYYSDSIKKARKTDLAHSESQIEMTSAENNGASSHPSTTGATATTAVVDGVNAGLVISTTDTIRLFLAGASAGVELSDDLRELASSLSDHPTVPYKHLRSVWIGSNPSTRPDLMGLLSGSNFVFCSPKPREKSEELKARLRKLEEASERKAYDELVKDITPRKAVDEPFSSYKDQMGFGLHVALTMFTGYLMGYYAFRALFSHSPAMSAAGGILGLVIGMLVETLLFIIRTSSLDKKPARKATSFTTTQKKNQ